MDHRRTQSAQARVYTPPAHPPPGARPPALIGGGGVLYQPGSLNANQYANASLAPGSSLNRRPSVSSADYYASNPSIDARQASGYSPPRSPPNSSQGSSYSPPIAFPEAGNIYRSTSANAYTGRRPERQDTITPGDYNRAMSDESFDRNQYTASVHSFSPEHSPSLRTEAFQQLSLDQDAIKRFQEGSLNDNDEEWHRLVDPEARNALPSKEGKRQSVLFEVVKSEREYVADLKILQEVFMRPLIQADPPIIPIDRIQNFVNEVFWNFMDILGHHERLLAALFQRQRDQHPVIASVSDLITESILASQDDYESYIKHYPLAEARHRREMRRNAAYQEFLSKCTHDKRTRKRDLITFISRPVTRLPRLRLLLETVQKHTEEDHPDAEGLPIILDIMGDFLKSTQPGIAAAEGRVKFVSFCENLTFRKGELIDMDLYNENRTMIHMSPVARKDKKETTIGTWGDYTAVLLDHYFILTREEARGEVTRYFVVSRPIPLDFLRLGPFIGPPETRREAPSEGGFLNLNNLNIFGETRNLYPFVISDATSDARRYTLWAGSERERTRWKEILEETMSIRAAYTDANKLFAFNVLSDDFMRERTALVPSSNKKGLTGLMISALIFTLSGRAYLAVATQNGIYLAYRSDPTVYTRVLDLNKITIMAALPQYDRLLVLNNGSILSYSLRTFVDVAQSRVPAVNLDHTLVKITPKFSGQVNFFRVGRLNGKDMLVYDTRSFGSSTLHTLEIRSDGLKDINKKGAYLPGVATDVQFLSKVLAIVSNRGMTVLDPFNIQNVLTVPDFSNANSNEMMAALKAKCDASRTLGIVPVPNGELLCIYDEYGCYITKHGEPTRKCGFVRWEVKANTFVFRAPHILLFGENFVEIRHAPTGQFRQMLERKGVRSLEQTGLTGDVGEFLVAWKGEKNDEFGQSDALVEVLETRELSPVTAHPERSSLERNLSTTSAVSPAPIDPLWADWS